MKTVHSSPLIKQSDSAEDTVHSGPLIKQSNSAEHHTLLVLQLTIVSKTVEYI